MKYLLVDDDKNFIARLAKALENTKAKVFTANSISEAKKIISSNSLDRAIIDLRMPNENGIDLISWISNEYQNIKTLVLTGFGSIATTQIAIKQGAFAYLTKPCSVTKIISAFEEQPSYVIEPTPLPTLAQVEWDYLNRVLVENKGNISQTAKILGMERRSLQRKLARAPLGKIQ